MSPPERKPPAPPGPGASSPAWWLERRDNRNRTHEGRRPSRREEAREDTLRDWFGPELARGAILAHQRPAESAGDVLQRVLSKLDMAPGLLLSDLQAHWAELVGPDVARRSSPAAIQGTRLTVEVLDSTWLYMLEQFHKRQIVARVREFTREAIVDIRFAATGRRPPPRAARPPPRAARPPPKPTGNA